MAGPLRPVQRHQHLLVTLLLVLPVPGELDVGHCDRQDECAAAIRTIRKLESERVGFGKKRKRGREDVMVRIRPGWTCPAKVPHWLQRFLDCWHGAHQQRSAITAKKLKRYSFGHAAKTHFATTVRTSQTCAAACLTGEFATLCGAPCTSTVARSDAIIIR